MEEKYKKTFIKGLSLEENYKVENLNYNEIDEWDSIGHMTLVSELEDTFDITLDTDDIVNFSSYNEGKKILIKLGIKF
jgi:acyl carrier protein